MLVTSIFSISQNIFYPIRNSKNHFMNFKFVVCYGFHAVWSVKILSFVKDLTLYYTNPTLMIPRKRPFENIVGEKGENAGNQHFLLFPQCFISLPKLNFNL